ncbi:hypothetical protein SOVF_142270, partial [Spinacia oleracea]
IDETVKSFLHGQRKCLVQLRR